MISAWKIRGVCVAAAMWVLAGTAAEAQWGSIKGRVILDGEVPPVKLLIKKGDAAAKDAAVCAAQDIPDEAVVVDPSSKGIANVAIYLRKAPTKVHPDLKKPEKVSIVYDQKFCKFIPHMAVVQAGQSVEVLNSDEIAHNTRGNPLKNQGFNFVVPGNTAEGSGVKVPVKQGESVPVQVKCDIHPWMTGWWVMVDHPYAVVTGEDGTFEIKGLPAGEHEFRVWQEKVGYLEKSLKVTVKADAETVVPDIKVPSKTLFN